MSVTILRKKCRWCNKDMGAKTMRWQGAVEMEEKEQLCTDCRILLEKEAPVAFKTDSDTPRLTRKF